MQILLPNNIFVSLTCQENVKTRHRIHHITYHCIISFVILQQQKSTPTLASEQPMQASTLTSLFSNSTKLVIRLIALPQMFHSTKCRSERAGFVAAAALSEACTADGSPLHWELNPVTLWPLFSNILGPTHSYLVRLRWTMFVGIAMGSLMSLVMV